MFTTLSDQKRRSETKALTLASLSLNDAGAVSRLIAVTIFILNDSLKKMSINNL